MTRTPTQNRAVLLKKAKWITDQSQLDEILKLFPVELRQKVYDEVLPLLPTPLELKPELLD